MNFADLLPPLATEEFEALKADIKANGVLHPVLVDESGNVLDGRHRLTIDPKAPRKVLKGLSEAEKEAAVFRMNFVRRNLSPSQKEEARQKMKATAGKLRTEDARKWTQKRVAEALGVSQQAVASWFTTITNAGNGCKPDARTIVTRESKAAVAKRVAAGETQSQVAADLGVSQQAISKIVHAEAKRKENKSRVEAITKKAVKGQFDGLYDVIVIDPPWPMEKIERECRPNQIGFDYPTMTEAKLAAFRLPLAADCHVWTWTTHRFLPMAFRLLEAWKLKYVCTFVWHKPGGFQPVGLPQFNCEFALYARCGSPKFSSTKALPTCFELARGKHSEKPDGFYDMVRRVTRGRRIDIFSRRTINGFDGWGNEA